jgi:uncharacterized protein YbaR (Trm112 family)
MIDDTLVARLRCPETGQKVRRAPENVMRELHSRQADGRLRDVAGNTVSQRIEGGLIREDGARVFPIRNGIPVMLPDEAIAFPD